MQKIRRFLHLTSSRARPKLQPGSVPFDQLPVEIHLEVLRYLPVSTIPAYGSTYRTASAICRDDRTWHHLIAANYGYDYTGSFPRQAYMLAESLQQPLSITRDIHEALENMASYDHELKAFAKVMRFKAVSQHRKNIGTNWVQLSVGPIFVFINSELRVELSMEPSAFTITLIPTSREYGYVSVEIEVRAPESVVRFLIDKIEEYTTYLASHPPMKPRKFLESLKERNEHLKHEYRGMRRMFHRYFNMPLATIGSYSIVGPSSPTFTCKGDDPLDDDYISDY
jgi:hypothetical protein